MAMRLMAEMREAGFQFRVADLLKPSSIEDLLSLNAGQAEKQVLDHSERGSMVSSERSPTVSQAAIVLRLTHSSLNPRQRFRTTLIYCSSPRSCGELVHLPAHSGSAHGCWICHQSR